MGGKKMEGNEEQRRQKAREGGRPSERGGTKGASKQRRHEPTNQSHPRKLEAIREGKQPDPGIHVSKPRPRPRSG